jgi:AraC-like DNA-binding protein
MAFEFTPIRTDISITGFHSIYYFEFDIDFYHTPETHDFWELVYVDYGTIDAIVDGVGCSLSSGQVIFHQPMESHTHIGNGRDAGNVVVISFSCDSPVMSFFNRKIFSLQKTSKKVLSLFLAEATNALGAICRDYNDTSPLDFSNAPLGSTQLMQGYLTEFLFSLIRNNSGVTTLEATQNTRQMAENSLVNSILYFIQDNLNQPPSLETLCTRFSLGRTYLSRIFKEATGSSPVDYWIHAKIKEAKKLIREGNLNITQISEILGYSGIHHFTRMFKRITGMSPTDYKNTVVK